MFPLLLQSVTFDIEMFISVALSLRVSYRYIGHFCVTSNFNTFPQMVQGLHVVPVGRYIGKLEFDTNKAYSN